MRRRPELVIQAKCYRGAWVSRLIIPLHQSNLETGLLEDHVVWASGDDGFTTLESAVELAKQERDRRAGDFDWFTVDEEDYRFTVDEEDYEKGE